MGRERTRFTAFFFPSIFFLTFPFSSISLPSIRSPTNHHRSRPLCLLLRFEKAAERNVPPFLSFQVYYERKSQGLFFFFLFLSTREPLTVCFFLGSTNRNYFVRRCKRGKRKATIRSNICWRVFKRTPDPNSLPLHIDQTIFKQTNPQKKDTRKVLLKTSFTSADFTFLSR